MNRRSLKLRCTLGLLVVSALGPTLGCGSPDPRRIRTEPRGDLPPNVLLISIDSLRPDHLGAYGYTRRTSPNIDRLAREGVLFEEAISTTSWTLPAHVSMLTSLYPAVHGVTWDETRLSDAPVLCSEVFQAAGYSTVAVVSGPYLSRSFGYDQGFDLYDDETVSFQKIYQSHRGVTTPKLHRRALELLDEVAREPFFLFLHYWDVHYDYMPPAPYDSLFDPGYDGDVTAQGFEHSRRIHPGMDPRDLDHVVALYDGEIAFVDSFVGKLREELETRDLLRHTLIALTADHGDEFFEHGAKGHRKNLYGTTLRVPLIVRFPDGRWAGRRIPSLVSIVDIAPTLLEAVGLEVPSDFNGRSLLARIEEVETPRRNYAFASLGNQLRSVRDDDWKLIARRSKPGPPELYDLSRDPEELHDLAGVETSSQRELSGLLARWMEVAPRLADRLGSGGSFDYDPELKQALESLGYLE